MADDEHRDERRIVTLDDYENASHEQRASMLAVAALVYLTSHHQGGELRIPRRELTRMGKRYGLRLDLLDDELRVWLEDA